MNPVKKVVLSILCLAFSAAVYARQVLFISSYSEAFETVDLQKAGIHSVFDKAGVSLDIEYMNMKQYNTAENEKMFYQHLKYKLLRHDAYDAVLLGDDAALVFAEKYQNELFSGIPLVFFCVNDFDRAKEAGKNPMITGAVEEMYLKDTIDTALSFQKNALYVVSIYDNTLTGKGDQAQFYSLRSYYPGCIFSGINASEYTHENFIIRLESIAHNSIVLYQSAFEDAEGKPYTISEMAQCIADHTHVPVYRASIGGVGEGLLGGKMVSYENSGSAAAEIVMQIFNGKKPSEIPVQMTGKSQYIFDYKVIQKFDINPALIPSGSILLNKNQSLFDKYRRELPVIGALVVIVLLVIIMLINDNVKRRGFVNQFLYQAEHDFLTGLLNRRAVMYRINSMNEQGKKIALILLDIDDFKLVNDAEGHSVGDAILKEAARRMWILADREECKVARFSGDEFLFYTDKIDPTFVQSLVEKIIGLFNEPISSEYGSYLLKLSLGVAASSDEHESSEALIANADLAMYSIKRTGKNNYAYFDEKMKYDIMQKKMIESALEDACNNDGFKIVYQPQVNTGDGTTYCYEALLRLKNKSFSPAQFIPVAENSDTIIKIGRIVMRLVVSELSALRSRGQKVYPVSVNFSSMQLRDVGYVDYMKKLFAQYEIPPSLIEIEITESIFLGRTERAMKLFSDFASAGVSLTLDDFGTGYSSINYLTYIPVKKIKLDKSLIDIYLQEGKDAFVENIIRLAHSLNLKITVEGIEKKEQYERLKEFSCDYIQGYYFSRPVSSDALKDMYLPADS